jgi:predicted nucleic acid-binding Zn ribbon protein
LKEAIDRFLKEYNLEGKLNETRLVNSWEKVAGKLIARHTKEIFVKDRVLYIKTDIAALKQELTYQKSKLIAKLNKAAGASIIEDIRFI